MKKILLLLVMLPFLAAAGFAQESRQDVSVSGSVLWQPAITGNAVHQTATLGFGTLVSYRFMLSPHSALEGNYGYSQNIEKYVISTNTARVHNRFQEISAAYVYNFNWKNLNPFVEAGAAGLVFRPILDYKTTWSQTTGNTNVGALGGAGVAYEVSPSFDIRVEYRGFFVRSPTIATSGTNNFRTNMYNWISDPVVGVAYHF
jgi:outer membrane immunogenic protein